MLNNSEKMSLQTNNSFWGVLREAFQGSQRDFTEGSVGQALFILSVPMIMEMIMESVFAVVDIFFVAKLGPDAIAIVGITESMVALIYAISIGLGIGATATVARRIGEKDSEKASQAAAHAIYLGLIVSIILGIIGVIFAADFLRLLGGSENVVMQGTAFTQIMLGGNAVVIFLFLLNSIFRGAGDAAIAMKVLWIANIINIILCPCFIFGLAFFPEMGVTGAAIATTIGRGSGVLLAFYYLFRGEKRFEIQARHWVFNGKLLWSLIKISSSAVLQLTIAMVSWAGLIKVISRFGSEVIAGYTISLRIIMFVFLPSLGLSNATATLVGQNLGAKKPEKAEKAVWLAIFYNVVFQTIIGVLLTVFAVPLVSLFTNDSQVIFYGSESLRIVSYGFFFYAVGMVLESAFNGAGDTWTPTYLNFFIFWVFEIPLAYFLANNFGYSQHGVFWAITISFSCLAIFSGILFKRGKWKLKKI